MPKVRARLGAPRFLLQMHIADRNGANPSTPGPGKGARPFGSVPAILARRGIPTKPSRLTETGRHGPNFPCNRCGSRRIGKSPLPPVKHQRGKCRVGPLPHSIKVSRCENAEPTARCRFNQIAEHLAKNGNGVFTIAGRPRPAGSLGHPGFGGRHKAAHIPPAQHQSGDGQ